MKTKAQYFIAPENSPIINRFHKYHNKVLYFRCGKHWEPYNQGSIIKKANKWIYKYGPGVLCTIDLELKPISKADIFLLLL